MDEKVLLNLKINGERINHKVLEGLRYIHKTCSQRKASEILGISPPALNRYIRETETKIGEKLIKSKNTGSELTSFGMKILKIYDRYLSRLKDFDRIVVCGGYISSNLIGKLAENHGTDIFIYASNDYEALQMARKYIPDILTLDDPLLAYKNDLNFIPIAYDYLSIVSKKKINKLEKLGELKFINVPYTSQRFGLEVLKEKKIKCNIDVKMKSPYDAFFFAKEKEDFYTFLNASKFQGSNLLKNETRHVISIIPIKEKREIKRFIDFILGEGQKIVEKEGFISINR